MGTNKTRNSIPSSTTKDRLNFTTDMRWDDANVTWDDSDPMTWDDAAVGPSYSTVNSTMKSRNSIPSSSNKNRN